MTSQDLKNVGRGLALPVALLSALWLGASTEWPREQVFMSGILVLASWLWITEAVPLFVTSLVVILAEVILLANPGEWPGLGFAAGEGTNFAAILHAAVNPILVLFLAGLLMARAAVNERVDEAMAAWLLRPFLGSRRWLLFGVMGVTALFSMWMSNTATTAFMLTLTMPLLAQVDPADPYRKALLLAVPFAANIGGLGTPIASPPNAIALGYLRQAGVELGFLQWMIMAVPLMIVLIGALGWWVLRLSGNREPVGARVFSLPVSSIPRRARWVVALFVGTALLWLTEAWHGLPTAVVALLSMTAMLVGGFVGRRDVNGLEWDVLMLIGGGLALGHGLSATGLDLRIVALLPGGGSGFALIATLVITTYVLSTLISNSAVSNLLLPIGLAAAYGESHLLPVMLAIALTASLAMALPVSTPPNAMAYARGELVGGDMVKAGIPVGLLGMALILLIAFLY